MVPVLLALLSAVPGGTWAAPKDAFQQHYDQAMGLYRAEHFRGSIAEFSAAYRVLKEPRLLINIGRAYFKLGEPDRALSYYQRYLQERRHSDTDARRKVLTYIAEAKQRLETQGAAAAEPSPTPEMATIPDEVEGPVGPAEPAQKTMAGKIP